MENNDKNKNDIFNISEGNKENVENRPIEENTPPLEDNMDESVPDLDGDGFIGNTGGFYGGTSYIGSNYGPDWNSNASPENQTHGNFGAAGQSDHTDISRNNEGDSTDNENVDSNR